MLIEKGVNVGEIVQKNRARRPAMEWKVNAWLAIAALCLFGCGVREIPNQKAALVALAASNAPLSTVKSGLRMNFDIRQRGSPEWDRMLQAYKANNSSTLDKKVVTKMEKAAAVGFTSSETMATYIFLDEQDRLIDFEVGTQ